MQIFTIVTVLSAFCLLLYECAFIIRPDLYLQRFHPFVYLCKLATDTVTFVRFCVASVTVYTVQFFSAQHCVHVGLYIGLADAVMVMHILSVISVV